MSLSDKIMNVYGGGNKDIPMIHQDAVRESVREIKERDKQLILWARQWAEHVDDEEVLEKWERRALTDSVLGSPVKELLEIFGEELMNNEPVR